MKYSNLCNFKCNYNIDKNIKHNVIIVTLFRLKHLYRKFDEYLNGLIGFDIYLSKMDTIPNDIKLRVYWNQSIYATEDDKELTLIKEAFKKINKNKHIQLIEYSCSLYKLDDIYDRGIFPFFIRYFPLFNFEDNDTNFIFATDIDVSHKLNYYEYIINNFNNIIGKKMDFYYLTSKCYIPFWKKKLGDDSISLLGSNIGGNYKFDHNILTNFLKDCEFGIESNDKLIATFYKNYIEYVTDNKIPLEMRYKKVQTYKIDKIFLYGLDEFFITYYLFKNILINKKLKNIYEQTKNISSGGGLIYLFNKVFNNVINNINNKKETIELYRTILFNVTGKTYESHKVLKKLKKFIEKFKDHDYENKTKKPKLYNLFYKEITKNIESNNFTFLNIKKDRFLKCFLDNDKYYTDKNNINRIRTSTRKKYYKFLNI
jgi:hypothetical protein